MDAKISNFSELSNILSVKSSLRTNLMSLFTRFGLVICSVECPWRSKEHAEVSSDNASYIFDDTTLEKTGYGIKQISRVFDHVQGKCILGFKLLVCAFFDGKSTIPID